MSLACRRKPMRKPVPTREMIAPTPKRAAVSYYDEYLAHQQMRSTGP
jgi:hypothetical protein